MQETEGLEPQQFQEQYWEDDVPLRDVRKSVLRRLVYLGAFLFLLFILAGSFIKFPDEVQLPFIFKTDKSEEVYRFPYPVYLMDKYVASGNNIKKGVSMLRITSPEIVSLINNYYEAQQNLVNYCGQKSLSVEKQKEIISIKMEQDRLKITQTQKELVILDSTWSSNQTRLEFEKEDAENKLKQNKVLHAGHYISTQELKQFETNKIIATDSAITGKQNYEREKSSLLSLNSQYSLDIVSLGQELNKLSLDTKYDSVQFRDQLDLAAGKIRNTFGDFGIENGGLVLKANADEMVSFLFEGEKEIPGGVVLLKMKYSNTQLYSIINCPPSIVGKLKNGQHVFLKVATFPAYEWGAVAGHIDNISLTPDEKGSFNVRVVLDDLKKLSGRLQPGMNGNATIVLSEKTFFEYFFRNVKKTIYNSTMNN